jgi:flagellin-like hook-associated protein FlgL
MTHPSILATAVLAAVLAAGCDKAIDDQTKANNAQAEANDKIATATKEADQKILAAQAEADKKTADANASFMKLREDYRHQTTNNLVDLDHKVGVLEASSRSASANKAKFDLDANLNQIHTKRAEFGADYKSIEAASAMTWDDTKTRLDKEWTELKALVDKA